MAATLSKTQKEAAQQESIARKNRM